MSVLMATCGFIVTEWGIGGPVSGINFHVWRT